MFVQSRTPSTPWSYDPLGQTFETRVVIREDELERLSMREHEPVEAIPPAFAWCIARLGPGGERWMLEMPADGDAAVYFACPEDALQFVEAFGQPQVALAA